MTAQRRRLPNRRPHEVHELKHHDEVYQVGVGRDPDDNAILEVFVTGPKLGSHMRAVLDDASILASLALQGGATPADLAKSMSREPTVMFRPARAPATPIAAAMDLLSDLSRSHNPKETLT